MNPLDLPRLEGDPPEPYDEPDTWRAIADDLAAALTEAREDMAEWGAYANDYFKQKWDLAGDLARCDAALARWQKARR